GTTSCCRDGVTCRVKRVRPSELPAACTTANWEIRPIGALPFLQSPLIRLVVPANRDPFATLDDFPDSGDLKKFDVDSPSRDASGVTMLTNPTHRPSSTGMTGSGVSGRRWAEGVWPTPSNFSANCSARC